MADRSIDIRFESDEETGKPCDPEVRWSDDIEQEQLEEAAVFLLRICADESDDGLEACLERLFKDAIQFNKHNRITHTNTDG